MILDAGTVMVLRLWCDSFKPKDYDSFAGGRPTRPAKRTFLSKGARALVDVSTGMRMATETLRSRVIVVP
jgi:hypothetical protein